MRHLAPCFNIQPCIVRNVHVIVKVPMIFEKGSKVQAFDELGRWEKPQVSKVTGDDRFLVTFVGWGRKFDQDVFSVEAVVHYYII